MADKKVDLHAASASGDPEAQQLLAKRETARLNNDEKGIEAIDKALVDLGYTK